MKALSGDFVAWRAGGLVGTIDRSLALSVSRSTGGASGGGVWGRSRAR